MLLDEEGKESQRLVGKTDGGEITSELLSSIFSTIFREKKQSVILLKMQNTIGFLYCICLKKIMPVAASMLGADWFVSGRIN